MHYQQKAELSKIILGCIGTNEETTINTYSHNIPT